MFNYILIVILSIIIVYNLSKYVEIMYKAPITLSNYASILLIILILIALLYNMGFSVVNIALAIVFSLYSISAIICKGFNRKGVITTGSFTFIAKFVKWSDVKAMDIVYEKDGYIDMTIVTDKTAFTQRYKEELDVVIIKIKKELKL